MLFSFIVSHSTTQTNPSRYQTRSKVKSAVNILFQCFQTGFCEAASTADPSWAITAPPTESPAGTGMASTHTNTLFAPYVVPYEDAGEKN